MPATSTKRFFRRSVQRMGCHVVCHCLPASSAKTTNGGSPIPLVNENQEPLQRPGVSRFSLLS